jgi:hypothetical protein
MTEITAAAAVLQSGDRAGARARLESVWSRIAGDPEPVHECVLSHYMADVQDDPAEELTWDLRALDAALRCTDADARRHGQTFSVVAFMPSLHASLAGDYLKLGDVTRSREHLDAAQSFESALADDSYGQLIRSGIERLSGMLKARGA